LAEEAEPQLIGPGQLEWLDLLDLELGNLRGALAWSEENSDGTQEDGSRAEIGLRLAGALGWFWLWRGYAREGRQWLETVLARTAPAGPTLARGRSLYSLGGITLLQGDYQAMKAASDEGVRLSRALGDQQGVGRALNRMGIATFFSGDPESAQALHEESLVILRRLGDAFGLAWVLQQLGRIRISLGDTAGATEYLEESVALFRRVGNRFGLATSLSLLSEIVFRSSDQHRATELIQEALVVSRELRDSWATSRSLIRFAAFVGSLGQGHKAARLLGAAEGIAESVGIVWSLQDQGVWKPAEIAARQALGDDAFSAALAAGRAMSLDQAVAYAFDESARR
jgi:tetratricopeptide (TPR) repeat protein